MFSVIRRSRRFAAPQALLVLTAVAGLALQTDAGGANFEELNKTGSDLIAKGELSKAEALFHEALDRTRKQNDRSWTAEFLRRIGEVHQRTEDLGTALTWYNQALEIREALGQEPETAYLLVGTGWVKMRLGDTAGAADRIERGRDLYHALGDTTSEANALTLLAQVSAARNDFEKADEQYRDLLALYQKLNLPAGIAACRAAHAESYFQRSQYRNALSEAFAAVDTAAAAAKNLADGDQRRNVLTIQGNAIETAANVYQRLVQPARALQYYQDALHIRQELHDRARTASVLTNMGPLLVGIGKVAESAAGLEQALAIRRGLGNSANTATTLMALAETNLAQRNPEAATKEYEEALTLASPGSASQAVALYQLGNISLEAGRLDDALTNHVRALEIRQRARDPRDVVRSWTRIGIVREQRGELPEADAAHLQALHGFEKLRIEVADPVQLGAFRETAARLYPAYSRVLFKEGKTTDALLIAERSRGQALSRMYGTQGARFLDLLTESERARWSAAASSLAKASNRLRIALEQSAPDGLRSDAYAAWADARTALSRTRDRIFADNSKLQKAESPSQPDGEALFDLSRRNPGTMYIEWLVVDNASTLLFSLASGELKAYLLPTGSVGLQRLASQWRKALVRADGRGVKVYEPEATPDRPEPDCAQDLYAAALGPLAASLESGKWNRIVAVSDGPLLDAPLAALRTSQGKRLIDSFTISSVTSFSSFVTPPERRAAASDILVVGDPIEPGKVRVLAPSGDTFEALVSARGEARSIAALFPRAVNLSGANAREGEVKERMDCCSILHFATHGVLDSQDGMDSGLLLAAEPENSTEDGLLQAWEIAGMRLNAKLAILSACDTARGDRRLGEGLMGLAWAFQAAGVPAVVASVWSVNDAATAELMGGFYAELRKGVGSDDAMRSAMLKTREQAGHSAPYFWAGFSLIGSANSIQ